MTKLLRYLGAAEVICAVVVSDAGRPVAQSQAQQGFGVCKPVSERHGDRAGCWILTDAPVGTFDRSPVFWHLDRYSTRGDAERKKGAHGVVLDALGAHWVATIGTGGRQAEAGPHVADIGPIPVEPGRVYSAVFMEAIMAPGGKSAIHTHSGPEAWYTESGATCLETPPGTIVGRRGDSSTIVPAGPPMESTAVGNEERRGLTLILHDASKPPTTMERTWKPKGLCQPNP